VGRTLTAVPDPPPQQPDLRDAVRDSLASMPWLGESDRALRELAARYADEIEKAAERAAELEQMWALAGGNMDVLRRLSKLESQCDASKAVGWLGPQLLGVLRELGGTPRSRAELGGEKKVGGRLAQLRAARDGQDDT